MSTHGEADYMELCEKLRRMRLSSMAEVLEKQSLDPNLDLRTSDERIEEIINAEWIARQNKKLNRFLTKADLRYPNAAFDEALEDPERKLDVEAINRLATCEWIGQKKNLLITGKSSTGKSYAGNALAVCAIQRYLSVRYVKASYLMTELEKAHIQNELLDYVKDLSSLALLIIDDFGLMELDPDKCRYLFEVLDARDGRGSVMVISQVPVSSWHPMFKDNTYADACMERLIRGAYRLEFNGKNMRKAKEES